MEPSLRTASLLSVFYAAAAKPLNLGPINLCRQIDISTTREPTPQEHLDRCRSHGGCLPGAVAFTRLGSVCFRSLLWRQRPGEPSDSSRYGGAPAQCRGGFCTSRRRRDCISWFPGFVFHRRSHVRRRRSNQSSRHWQRGDWIRFSEHPAEFPGRSAVIVDGTVSGWRSNSSREL